LRRLLSPFAVHARSTTVSPGVAAAPVGVAGAVAVPGAYATRLANHSSAAPTPLSARAPVGVAVATFSSATFHPDRSAREVIDVGSVVAAPQPSLNHSAINARFAPCVFTPVAVGAASLPRASDWISVAPCLSIHWYPE
jgi:hypothetical protein